MEWYLELIILCITIALSFGIDRFIFKETNFIMTLLFSLVLIISEVALQLLSYYYFYVVIFILALLFYLLFINKSNNGENK